MPQTVIDTVGSPTTLPVLAEILHSGRVRSDNGETVALHSHIAPESGRMLQQIIRDIDARVTLEIGMGFGVSTLFICQALAGKSGARHIAIDPHQHGEDWRGIGLRNVREAGFEHLLDFRELPAHQAIPDLEREGARVDFAFVDGWHTFDFVMVDLFLVDRILRVGGVVVMDDTEWLGVRKACRYFITNRHHRVVGCWGEGERLRLPRLRRALAALARRFKIVRRGLKPELAIRDEDLGLVPGCRCVALMKTAEDDGRLCFGHEPF